MTISNGDGLANVAIKTMISNDPNTDALAIIRQPSN